MKMNKLSIKSKITFWYIGLMISLIVIFLITIIYISENLVRANAYKNLKSSVVSAFDEIEVYDGELTIDNDFIIFNNNVHLSVYDDETGFIYGDIPLDFEYDETFSDKNDVRIIKHKNKKWYIFDSKKNFSGYGIIHIRGIAPATEVENIIETIVLISLIVLPFFLLFSAISGYFITKKAFKPIEKIRGAAEKINEGNDLTQRINIGEGNDEIYTLANTFDTMFDRLQSSFEREAQFTSDVSHELRTPVSIIISECEYGLENLTSIENARNTISSVLDETKKMSKLISQLLTLSRMDRGNQKLNFDKINISEMAHLIADSQQHNADNKNIKIHSEIEEDIFIVGDETMIMRIFVNLISNAVNYGCENGNIWIKLSQDKNFAICKIIDDGIGIEKENIPKIWGRFYQVESSRTTENIGLGLSMVKWIIEAHNGEIYVESEIGKGSSFVFKLKKERK
ncbi:sensor histidine kinase [Leptotrichia trevisanii]